MSDQDFDPRDADFEQDAGKLFALARRTREVSPGAKLALHAAVLAAAATTASAAAAASVGSAAAVADGAVVAGTTAGQAVTTASSATVATVATTGSVALKTLLGALSGVLLGTVLVAASVASEGTSRPPAPAETRASAVRADVASPGATTSASPPANGVTSSAPPAASSVPTEAAPPPPPRVARSSRPNVNLPDESPASPRPAPPVSADSLADEAAALREVSRALAQGSPEEALRLLGETPHGGSLAEERAAARIVALCRSGRRDEAAALRATFEAEHPRSNQRARIETACRVP